MNFRNNKVATLLVELSRVGGTKPEVIGEFTECLGTLREEFFLQMQSRIMRTSWLIKLL